MADLLPHLSLEVVLVKIVAIVAIVATKYIHVVIIDDAGVRVARTWALLWVKRIDLLPLASLNTVFVEVINPVVSIIAAKNVDLARMHHCCVAIARTGRRGTTIRIELAPSVCREIEAVEVITTVGAIIATKYVEVVIQGDRGVQGTRAGWVHLVLR